MNSEDEDAAAWLNDFYKANGQHLFRAGCEGALYGRAVLGAEYDNDEEAINLITHAPAEVTRVARPTAPWKTDGFVVNFYTDGVTYEQRITRITWDPPVAAGMFEPPEKP